MASLQQDEGKKASTDEDDEAPPRARMRPNVFGESLRTSSTASLASLPPELLAMIGEHAPEAAASLCLVNHSFYAYFAPLRYHKIDFPRYERRNFTGVKALSVALKVFLENPGYADAVRILVLPCEGDDSPSESYSKVYEAESEYFASAAEKLEVKFRPALADELHKGEIRARYLLLLHILKKVEVLEIVDWCTDDIPTLEEFLEERLEFADGDMVKFSKGMPDGFLSLREWHCSHWDTENTCSDALLIPGFLLPRVHTVSGFACSVGDHVPFLNRSCGKSNVRRFHLAISFAGNIALHRLVSLCSSLEEFEMEWGSALGDNIEGFVAENMTLRDAFAPARHSLRSFTISGHNASLRFAQEANSRSDYAGFPDDYAVLETLKMPMKFLTLGTDGPENLNWAAILPKSVKILEIEDGRRDAKTPFDVLRKLLQQKMSNPSSSSNG